MGVVSDSVLFTFVFFTRIARGAQPNSTEQKAEKDPFLVLEEA